MRKDAESSASTTNRRCYPSWITLTYLIYHILNRLTRSFYFLLIKITKSELYINLNLNIRNKNILIHDLWYNISEIEKLLNKGEKFQPFLFAIYSSKYLNFSVSKIYLEFCRTVFLAFLSMILHNRCCYPVIGKCLLSFYE